MFISPSLKKRGFTLVELIVILAIIALLVLIVTSSFKNLYTYQVFDKAVLSVYSQIENARTNTINSKNISQYGIHVTSTSTTLFQGETYTPGVSTNIVNNLPKNVTISTISIAGGGSNFYFNLLSGEPNATATLVFSQSGSTSTKSIYVYGSGLIDTQ